jgi:hypothetical protein
MGVPVYLTRAFSSTLPQSLPLSLIYDRHYLLIAMVMALYHAPWNTNKYKLHTDHNTRRRFTFSTIASFFYYISRPKSNTTFLFFFLSIDAILEIILFYHLRHALRDKDTHVLLIFEVKLPTLNDNRKRNN